jgi:hypothetical protein
MVPMQILPFIKEEKTCFTGTFLRDNEAIAGDAAFSFIETEFGHPTLTPRKGKNLSAEDKEYNELFIKLRLLIENVFGLLKLRWSILHLTFRHDEEKQNSVWYILASMHNEDIQSGRLEMRGSDFWEKWENQWIAVGGNRQIRKQY